MAKRPTRPQSLDFERPPHSVTSPDITSPDPSQALWRDPDTGRSYLVRIEWTIVQGRPEPVAFTVRGARSDHPAGLESELPERDESPAIVAAALFRRMAPGDLIDQARRDAGRAYTEWRAAHPDSEPEPTRDGQVQTWTLDQLRAAQSRPFRETTPLQQQLVQVWQDARRAGQPTTKAVAEHFDITYTNAAQRVARARSAGLLPRTTRGRAVADCTAEPEVATPEPKGERRRRIANRKAGR